MTKVLQCTVWDDTISAIGTDENVILDVNDIWRALDKRIINDGVPVRRDPQFKLVWCEYRNNFSSYL
jgi:hypothetical protein